MTSDLREKDLAVLQAIHDGATTVAEINEVTILSTREINYSLTEKSLEQQGLVEIHRNTGRDWREINGEERYVWTPKSVELTDKGVQMIANHEIDETSRYEDVSKRELSERLQELEERQNRLETVFRDFRESVMDRIGSS